MPRFRLSNERVNCASKGGEMTRQQAIRVYLDAFIHSDVMISRIMRFNQRLSVRDNANKMGINYDVMRLLCKRFGLKYKRVGNGNNYKGGK